MIEGKFVLFTYIYIASLVSLLSLLQSIYLQSLLTKIWASEAANRRLAVPGLAVPGSR